MRSPQSSSERARGFTVYRSQSRTFVIGPSYFSRAWYIMQTYRSTPRTAPHLLWKNNCV